MRPVAHHPPALSRRRVIPLPDEHIHHLFFHPVLSASTQQPDFAWDLSLGPWAAELSQEKTRYAPATAPPTRNPIYIHTHSLPYSPILVMPGSESAKFITVWDVVLAVYRTIRSAALRSEGLTDLESYTRFLIPQVARGGDGESEEVRQDVYDWREERVTTAIRKHLEDMTRWSGIRAVNVEENYYMLELGHR